MYKNFCNGSLLKQRIEVNLINAIKFDEADLIINNCGFLSG